MTTYSQSSLWSQRRIYLPGLALSALISTILLILMGSIVRVTGHGLGCPDWPLCYGQPIPPFIVGAWMEFIHRLIGAAASLQIILVGWQAWVHHRDNPWVARPGVIAVGLLAVQIVLGGIHVLLEIPPLTGLIHTAIAMIIVGLIAVIVAVVWPGAQRMQAGAREFLGERRFVTWVSITALATYVLLLTGSYVTRTGASLACPAFPWCGGNAPGTNILIQIQMLHRYAAFTVAFLVLVTIWWMLRRPGSTPAVKRYAYALLFLLVLQFALGIINVYLRIPMWSRALHLTVGSTLWVGVVILWTLSWRSRAA